MRKNFPRACPECRDTVSAVPVDRRAFLIAGAGLATLKAPPTAWAHAPATSNETAEGLIKELYGGLSDEQKKSVVSRYDDPARLKIYNKALGTKIGEAYSKTQQEVVGRILRAICADEAGWNQISRGGTWDASGAFENCGANLFGDPAGGKFTWVFSGHHLTLRCDGDPADGVAFGGPLYYGHSPNGYSTKNLFYYQTQSVLSLFDALSEAQRKQAVVKGTPGEGLDSVRFRPETQAKPGIAFTELTREQKTLVEKVMRDVLSPYRRQEADEVMTLIKGQGGLEKVHVAYYQEDDADAREPWHFWRLEGPGFVWNYRVLPHVHTFVSVAAKA